MVSFELEIPTHESDEGSERGRIVLEISALLARPRKVLTELLDLPESELVG